MEADFVCLETWASSHPPSYPRECKAVAVTHTQSGSKGCGPSLLGGGGWCLRGGGKESSCLVCKYDSEMPFFGSEPSEVPTLLRVKAQGP